MHDGVTPTQKLCVSSQREQVRILQKKKALIQQVALSRSGEMYKMWHFMTKHQPTDLFLFRRLSDGSDFGGPLRGFFR